MRVAVIDVVHCDETVARRGEVATTVMSKKAGSSSASFPNQGANSYTTDAGTLPPRRNRSYNASPYRTAYVDLPDRS